jgi:hypothetical protein
VLNDLAPEADWLDIRWCTDDETFYRELPEADVIWRVLWPLPELLGSDIGWYTVDTMRRWLTEA